jgi:nucleoside-diphosphate-sugar epimerase
MKKILITGGAGFVGRRFVKYFLENGDKVIVVDNIAPFTGGIDPKNGWPLFNPYDYKNFKFYKEDCRVWFNRFKDKEIDYSLHLAAMVGGRQVIENNPLIVADDLSIDSHYWQWAKINKPKKNICFSSSACYPIKLQTKNNYRLLKEKDVNFKNDISIPDLTYGWAKLTSEYLAKIAYEKHGLKSVCYRPFSGYGEDQDLSYPFPSICRRVLDNKNKNNLTVWGSGNQMRDFIYIDDCVNAVIKTMNKINNAEAMNLSNGTFINFKNFASQVANIVGYNPIIKGTTNKPEGVYARAGDTTKQKKFGVKNKVSLDKGIEKTINFLLS